MILININWVLHYVTDIASSFIFTGWLIRFVGMKPASKHKGLHVLRVPNPHVKRKMNYSLYSFYCNLFTNYLSNTHKNSRSKSINYSFRLHH